MDEGRNPVPSISRGWFSAGFDFLIAIAYSMCERRRSCSCLMILNEMDGDSEG